MRVEEVKVEEVRVLNLIVPSDDVCHLCNVSQDESIAARARASH